MFHDYAFHEAVNHHTRHYSGTAAAMMSLFAAQARMMGLKDAGDHYEAAGRVLIYGAKTYDKPAFNISETEIFGEKIAVRESTLHHKPFGDLVRFERDIIRNDPKILLVAPMSGHYATLLRGTVEALLPYHDVHITDWHNARNVRREYGRFDLSDYAAYIKDFIHVMGPDVHVVAVCQSAVPVLAAVSQMAADNDSLQPLSMTLMGAPIDPRANPTEVTRFADKHAVREIERYAISRVPSNYEGSGRLVYPGYKQLDAFMSMNMGRHASSPVKMFNHLVAGNTESAEKIGTFYDEYRAVMDMTAEFFLDTYETVFRRNALASGEMVLSDQLVNPGHVRKTALLTIEGGKDDISAAGQTAAAHRLCNNLSPDKKFSFVHPDVGHYGIFEGRRWREDIMPRLAGFFRKQGVDNHLKYDEIPADRWHMPTNFRAVNHALTSPTRAP